MNASYAASKRMSDFHVRVSRGLRTRDESVGRVAREVPKPAVASALVRAGPSRHHVRVDVHGVDGIANRDLHVVPEELLDVPAVALRAVGDEYLVSRDVDSAVLEVDLRRLLAQERVALLRTVSVEVLARRLVVDSLVHRLNDGVAERLGDVSDAEADDLRVRIRRLVRGHAVRDFGEQVAGLYLRVVFVYVEHGWE